MAAVVEIDEINGAGLVLHHGILNINFGSVDAFELDPVANKLALDSNSYVKWVQLHVSSMGDSSAVQNLRISSETARPAGSVLVFNGHVTQAIYDATKKTAAAQPGTGIADTPHHVPTVAPATSNIGFAGQLGGSLVAPGSSDFALIQVRLTTVTESADPVLNFEFDETA